MADSILLEILRESAGNIRSMKARSVMALIGIAIGTAAVIAMLHVGYNARLTALQQFEKMGTDLANVLPGTRQNGFTDLTEARLNEFALSHASITEIAAAIRVNAEITTLRTKIGAVGFAVSDRFLSILRAHLDNGRVFSPLDQDAPYVILGSKVAMKISAGSTSPIALGDQIQIGDKILTTIGVLKPSPANLIFRIDLDNAVLVPIKGARHLGVTQEISAILVRFSGAEDSTEASKLIYQEIGPEVSIQTAQQLIAGVEEQMRIYSSLLLAIGSVSLVVGGVGIMNVMLMNVVERRQEIGLRQALGARRKDIKNMFLIEALIVSGIGSAIGIAIGFLAAWAFAQMSGWQFTPSPFALPLGAFMAATVGLFFGSFPAMRASKLDPVAALRSI